MCSTQENINGPEALLVVYGRVKTTYVPGDENTFRGNGRESFGFYKELAGVK